MGHNKSNSHGIDTLLKTMALLSLKKGFSFTNLVDFDALYGTVVMLTVIVIAA